MNFIDDFNRLKNNLIFGKIIISAIAFMILIITSFYMIRYHVEGETKLPFDLTKIVVMSSAEGTNIVNAESKWALALNQNNDIYISINKNPKYKRKETIKKITIENIQINKSNNIGNIVNYTPAEEGLFQDNEKYVIQDKLEYIGNSRTNINALEIGNQGGTLLFRSSNLGVGIYNSNEEEQIIHDGTILSKVGLTNEQIQYTMKFDLIIETGKKIKYKGTITLNLPAENIIEKGKNNIEKTNFKDVIFKRI